MRYKAVVSFSGAISMAEGEIMEIANKVISDDLLDAGYIEEVEEAKNENKRTKSKRNM